MVTLSALSARFDAFRSEMKESVLELGRRAVTPRFLEDKVEATTRVGQAVALAFVPIVVMVSLLLIVVLNNLLGDIFGGWAPGTPQQGIFGFFITLVTLGMVLLAGWSWFQFVRTSGFGFFAWED